MGLRLTAVVLILTVSMLGSAMGQNKRDQQVREDHTKFADNENWIYADLEQATRTARDEKKPLMVVFRCIP